MRPSTKDNHCNKGSDNKDGKEAWEFEEVTSSESESFVLFLKIILRYGQYWRRSCRLDSKHF